MTTPTIRDRWHSLAAATFLLATACAGDDPADAAETDSAPDAGTSESGSVEASIDPCDVPTDELKWISIPSGSFSMGCSDGDSACIAAERPVRTVNVAAFELSATEVTQAQYLAQTGENPSKFDGCPTCPVDSVTWSKASVYCESQGGRLPTEAEWEYAARGGGTTAYGCGSSSCLSDAAWYDQNAAASTHPVGSKAPTDWCLYDMAGNVWEWVEDCWHDTYDGAPTDGSAWLGTECTYRVQRGGAFGVGTSELRVSSRGGDYPDIYFVPAPGFRCARSVQ